jgi:hypothetical protein
MSKVAKVWLRRLRLPLVQPLPDLEEFEPFLVEIEDDDGRRGFRRPHLAGFDSEAGGGWAFVIETIKSSLGARYRGLEGAALGARREQVAATLLVTPSRSSKAPDLVARDEKPPLLTPVNALNPRGL